MRVTGIFVAILLPLFFRGKFVHELNLIYTCTVKLFYADVGVEGKGAFMVPTPLPEGAINWETNPDPSTGHHCPAGRALT